MAPIGKPLPTSSKHSSLSVSCARLARRPSRRSTSASNCATRSFRSAIGRARAITSTRQRCSLGALATSTVSGGSPHSWGYSDWAPATSTGPLDTRRRPSQSRAPSATARSRWSQQRVLAARTSQEASSAMRLPRSCGSESDLPTERSWSPAIPSVFSAGWRAQVFSERWQFDEAVAHAEAAVRISEAADHPLSLNHGLFGLGFAHLRRGDLPQATRVIERCVVLCRTWEFATHTPNDTAALGVVYALTGRADEALPMVAGAFEEEYRGV